MSAATFRGKSSLMPRAAAPMEPLLVLLGPMGNSIERIFGLMNVAEEELARAGQPKGMFMALMPPETLRDFSPDVYRAHCRELLARHKQGKSLEEPTAAEMLAVLADMSLHAPFNATGAAAYMQLAEQVLKDEDGLSLIPPQLRDDPPREPYKGAAGELLSGLSQRMRVPGRAAEPTRATTLEAFA